MASSFVASRVQLLYALCLPVAVLLGYFLADPTDPSSMLMIFLVVALLSLPVFLRFHHAMLIFTWNAAFAPYFLPGQPFLWMILAFVGLGFGLLNRFTNAEVRFVWVPQIGHSLVFLAGVIAVTAFLRGGVGLRVLGSSSFGGKGYLYTMAAIAGYFALTSRRIPLERAGFVVGLFFLMGLTALIPNLAFYGGRRFDFIFYFFPAMYALEQAVGETVLDPTMARIGGLTVAATGLYCWLLVQYGLRGVFNLKHPLRLVLFATAVAGCAYGGFRAFLLLFLLTLVIQFYLERLFNARNMLAVTLGVTLLAAVALPNVQRLPFLVQRTLSFLPLNFSPDVLVSSAGSSQWRLMMWRDVVPMVPQYLLLGKGYAVNPSEMAFAIEADRRGFAGGYSGSIVSGDYHNGPLTLVIPLGIWGLAGFTWFVVASLRYLLHNHRNGIPELHKINTFLLAYFIAYLIHFVFIFGSFYLDLFVLTGLAGLSVSLNGPVQLRPTAVETEAEEALVLAAESAAARVER